MSYKVKFRSSGRGRGTLFVGERILQEVHGDLDAVYSMENKRL